MSDATATTRFERKTTGNDRDDDFFTVEFGGRKASVFRPVKEGKRTANYFVKGRPPGTAKEFYRGTGFATKGAAREAAHKLWKAALEGRWDALDATKLRVDKRMATIGEVIAAHERNIASFNPTLGAEAAEGYRLALRRVLSWARGSGAGECTPDTGKRSRRVIDSAAIDKLPAALLTEELVEDFTREYLRPAGADRLERGRRTMGLIATVRLARAMFQGVALKCYRGLELPPLAGFLTATLPSKPERRPKVLTDSIVREMAQGALALRTERPALYLVHLLFRHCGLGNDEIEHLLCGAIALAGPDDAKGSVLPDGDCRPIAGYLTVNWRADWSAKTEAREGRIALSPCVYAELQEALTRTRKGAGLSAKWKPAELLVPAAHDTERSDLINRAHNDFVRPWLGEFRKKSYELRRWGASKVARLHQSDAMGARFLRHAARTTATQYYLEGTPAAPITLGDCGV